MLDHNPQLIQSYELEGRTETMLMITNPARIRENSKAFQDSVNLLYTIDFSTGNYRTVMEKPADGVLKNLNQYAGMGWPRTAKMQGSVFAVAYEVEPKVYVYDLKDNSLIKTLDIPEAYHAEFKAVDFESRDQPEMKKTK